MECCSTQTNDDSCCNDTGKVRKFLTNDEKIEMLKEYQNTLEKETQGVSEKIAKLEKE